MVQLLKDLYGDDALLLALRLLFEFFAYFLAALVGALLREISLEKARSFRRVLVSSLAVAAALFASSTWLTSKIGDVHLLFGVAVLLSLLFPKLASSFKSGRIVKHIARLFSEKLYNVIKDFEDEEDMWAEK